MAEIYIVRHGERESHLEDSPLSPTGIAQAEATGRYLQRLGIKSLYSSPLRRAQHTAEIISHILGIPFVTDPRLRERLVWGDRVGESYEEFLEEWGKASLDRDYKPLYGDSSISSGNRLKKLIGELARLTPDPHIIITHSGLIGDFLRNVFSEELLPWYTLPKPVANSREVKIGDCSITLVEVNNGKYTLKQISDTSHLPENF